MQQANTHQSRRRKSAAIMAVILAILLMLTGTFAWLSINQRATNALSGTDNPGGRVHDDFDGQNKDVYAENFGDSNIFVRIQLSEYMDINGVPFATGATKTDKSTWSVHAPDNNNPAACANGNVDQFHKYVTWTMGGDDKIFMPTFNMVAEQSVPQSQWTDTTGIATDDITGTQNGVIKPGDAQADAGGHNYWANGDQVTSEESYWDGTQVATQSAQHTAHKVLDMDQSSAILAKNGVITMDDWIQMGKPTGNFWVYDADGWAYWANALAPGEATSLLLNGIKITNPDGTWYYAIDVNGEFCTAVDMDQWTGMSANATKLMDDVTGAVYSVNITTAGNASTVDLGSTLQCSAQVLKNSKAQAGAAVDWSIVGAKDSGTSISSAGLLTVALAEINGTLTIRATDPASGKYADIAINVGQCFTDSTGVKWDALTTTADGHKLFLTDQVYGLDASGQGTVTTSFYNTANVYTPYESSNLASLMDAWYADNSNVSTALKAKACDYAYPSGSPGGIEFAFNGSNYLNGQTSDNYFANDLDCAATIPGAHNALTTGKVFLLSITEANRYFAPPAGYVANPARVADNANSSSQARKWWLRSPGISATGPVACVGTSGHVYYATAAASNIGFRPALWINP